MATTGLPTDVISALDAPITNLKAFLSNYVPSDANVTAALVGPNGLAYVSVSANGDKKLAEATRDYAVTALTAAGITSDIFQAGRRASDKISFFQVRTATGMLHITDFKLV